MQVTCQKLQIPLIFYAIWRISIIIFQYFLQPIIKNTPASETPFDRLFYSWTHYWDAGHYILIASQGYEFPSQNFFPAWPILIHAVSSLGIPNDFSSFILTNILSLLNIILLFNIFNKITYSHQLSTRALLLFLTFPGTIFLLATYAENLFLFSALLSFYFLGKKLLLLSGLVGAITTGTRIVGIAISAAIIFSKNQIFNKSVAAIISTFGIFLYILFLHLSSGNPLLFVQAQKEWCKSYHNCTPTFPLQTISQDFLKIKGLHFDWVIVNVIVASVSILLLLKIFKNFKYEYAIYTALVILIPLSTGSTTSMTRYALVGFPLFVALAEYLKKDWIIYLVAIFFYLLQLKAVTDFTNMIWVG